MNQSIFRITRKKCLIVNLMLLVFSLSSGGYASSCKGDEKDCTASSECCSQQCVIPPGKTKGECTALGGCGVSGSSCTTDQMCCSHNCDLNEGKCVAQNANCKIGGAVCTDSSACCSGKCSEDTGTCDVMRDTYLQQSETNVKKKAQDAGQLHHREQRPSGANVFDRTH